MDGDRSACYPRGDMSEHDPDALPTSFTTAGSPPARPPAPARNPSAPPPPLMTWALVAVNAALFLAGWLLTGDPSQGTAHMGALVGAQVRAGAWWELVSAAFLHWSVTHVAMNMVALINLGPLVERVFGRRRLLLAYVVCGLGGNALVAFVKPEQLEAGASSSIWGLLTLIAALSLRPGGLISEEAASRLRPGMLRAIVINALISMVPGVSGLAHLGGGIAGALLGLSPWFRGGLGLARRAPTGFVASELEPERPEDEPPSIVLAAYLAAALALAGIGFGIWEGKPWTMREPRLERVELEGGHSAAIPQGLKAHSPILLGKTGTQYEFGDLARDPVVVDVSIWPDIVPAGREDTGQRSPMLESVRDQLADPMEGERLLEAPQLEREDGVWRLHVIKQLKNGVIGNGYYRCLGNTLVCAMAYRSDETPDAWQSLEKPVYASLK